MKEQDCFVSFASFWEMAIKIGQGRLLLPGVPDRWIADQMSLNGFAQEEKLPLVSRDPAFDAYGIKRIW